MMSGYEAVEIRVQYIDDVDPFNALASLKHAEPSVPKSYTCVGGIRLCDQIAGLKKFLRAPHKVRMNKACMQLLPQCTQPCTAG